MKTLVGLRILMNMMAMVMVGLMIGLQHSYNLHFAFVFLEFHGFEYYDCETHISLRN